MEKNQDASKQSSGQEEELLMDFSSMFKGKKPTRKLPPKNQENQTANTPNWLLEIPAKLPVTKQEIKQRRFMDKERWLGLSKTRSKHLKIMASVVSCFNYLSKETEKPLTCRNAGEMIRKVDGSLLEQGNEFDRVGKIKRMIQILNKETGKNVHCQDGVKLAFPNKVEATCEEQKKILLQQLTDPKYSFIYLTFQDVFCPIGFEITPLNPIDAFVPVQNISAKDQQLWIINGNLGTTDPSFCIKRWQHIKTDLETVWPNYLNIKETKAGVQRRPDASEQSSNEERGNSHCILRIFSK